MTEQTILSQHSSLEAPDAPENAQNLPRLYLSSADAGWEGLVAQAFYEPAELEDWVTGPVPDTSLILFAGGAMHIEQRHAHDFWKTQDFLSGSLILTPSGSAPAELRWKALSRETARTLHIHLSQDLLARTAEELASHAASQRVLVGCSGFRDPLLEQIGFALWRELEQRAPAGKLYAQTAAQMLAVHLLRHYTSPGVTIKEPVQGLTSQQMRRVVDFVQAHLGQEISLELLAQQTGFSPYYFARLFRQATGESPHQFVLRQRLEHAQRLLQDKNIPLAHIALESGFADQSHFTQVFKRHLGLTPRAYRQDCSI